MKPQHLDIIALVGLGSFLLMILSEARGRRILKSNPTSRFAGFGTKIVYMYSMCVAAACLAFLLLTGCEHIVGRSLQPKSVALQLTTGIALMVGFITVTYASTRINKRWLRL